MICITVPECEQWAKDQGYDPLILNPNLPWMASLSRIKAGDEFTLGVPTSLSPAEHKRFQAEIYECLLNVEISRNTIEAYKDKWEENCFWNHEAVMDATPVDKLFEPEWAPFLGAALIVGSGPSKDNTEFKNWLQKNEEGIAVFSAWSADLNADGQYHFIGHCDHRSVNNSIPEAANLIFTPYTSPEFVRLGNERPNGVFEKDGKLQVCPHENYVYLDRGNPWGARFAEKKEVKEHNAIVGNVVDMLVQCAIYAGHKKIRLIGVDLSCKTPEELFKYHPSTQEVIPAHNYRGEQVWTDEIFQTFQRGLEDLVARHPEIEFSMLSDQGVIVEGVPYEPA